MPENIYIITGEKNSGKTALLKNIYSGLKKGGASAGGIISEALVENGSKTAFLAVRLESSEKSEILSMEKEALTKIGRYFISEKAFSEGNEYLTGLKCNFIILDEIGRLELQGNGWAPALNALLEDFRGNLLLSVKYLILRDFLKRFRINPKKIVHANETDSKNIIEELLWTA